MKKVVQWIASIAVLGLGACNYTVGDCWPNGQGGGSADVGGGVVGPGGVGGYGDTPRGGGTGADACNAPAEKTEPAPQSGGGGAEPVDTWIDCKKLGLDPVECMIECAQAGVPCSPRQKHPYKLDGGQGDLFNCKNGWPTNTCSYNYPNGDTCIFFAILSLRAPVCLYTGGKK